MLYLLVVRSGGLWGCGGVGGGLGEPGKRKGGARSRVHECASRKNATDKWAQKVDAIGRVVSWGGRDHEGWARTLTRGRLPARLFRRTPQPVLCW